MRISTADCGIKTRWPQPLTLPWVENLLENPLAAPESVAAAGEKILESSASAELLGQAASLLSSRTEPRRAAPQSQGSLSLPAALSPRLQDSLRRILNAMAEARPHLAASHEKLTLQERRDLLRLLDFPVESTATQKAVNVRFRKEVYESMRRFDIGKLLAAAQGLGRALDGEIPLLGTLQEKPAFKKPLEIKTPEGNIVIGGAGDDRYGESQLKETALLVDLGGDNFYAGPAAGALAGEIKIVIDFGRNVTLLSTNSVPSAGAGIFGIGLFYLPNPEGRKLILTSSFAQGTGIAGVGGFFSRGGGSFQGDRYVQGVGAFGAGLFSSEGGEENFYQTNLYGQGVGFTRGAGIFRHTGSGARLAAGLVDPDPRESLGATSLCQGVGYGPRAYAGGGVGLCLARGDRLSFESSYFAQGAGYWHAVGGFVLEGSSCTLKARRYDQGSGIHSALGVLILNGDDNRLINWGVGPAFGWDSGAGWALLSGDRNKAQAEWGAVSAAMNASRSFSVFRGDGLQMDLAGLGGSQYVRNAADYAVSLIQGEGNMLKVAKVKEPRTFSGWLHTTPWGVLNLDRAIFTGDAGLAKQEWKELPQAALRRKGGVDLSRQIEEALSLPAAERVERLVQAAAAMSLNKSEPRRAVAHLLAAGTEDLPLIIRSFDPADVDGYIHLRNVIALLGEPATRAILDELPAAPAEKREIYLYLLSYGRSGLAAPALIAACGDPDGRVAATAIRSLGFLLDEEAGTQPGRMALLRSAAEWLASSRKRNRLREELLRRMTTRSFGETAAALSTGRNGSVEERLQILELAPPDINETLRGEEAKTFLSRIEAEGNAFLKNYRDELKEAADFQEQARKKLKGMLAGEPGRRPETARAIVTVLGQIGKPEDAPLIASRLDSDSAALREATLAALGRIGKGAEKILKGLIRSPEPGKRIQALIALSHASDPALLPILENGLADKSPEVLKAALAVQQQLQSPLAREKEKLSARLKRREPPPDLQAEKLFFFGD